MFLASLDNYHYVPNNVSDIRSIRQILKCWYPLLVLSLTWIEVHPGTPARCSTVPFKLVKHQGRQLCNHHW